MHLYDDASHHQSRRHHMILIPPLPSALQCKIDPLYHVSFYAVLSTSMKSGSSAVCTLVLYAVWSGDSQANLGKFLTQFLL